MSLFPAYNATSEAPSGEADGNSRTELAWLTNQSFIPFSTTEPDDEPNLDESRADDNLTDDTAVAQRTEAEKDERNEEGPPKRHRVKHKRKHKKKGSKRRRSTSSSSDDSSAEQKASAPTEVPPVRISESDYYTDVDPLKIYLTVEKLHRPACPRYRLGTRKALGMSYHGRGDGTPKERCKRYFKVPRKEGKTEGGTKVKQDEVFAREAELERTIRAEETVEKWLELVHFRQDHPIHFDSYQNHKRELTLVERARRHFPSDERLLQLYLDAIVRVHPTDEVLDLIRRAIAKDETNVILWRALIRNKQCAMAQCIVPDVLKLYERSTRSLFMARRSDETMLQLFRNCATFCRQAGLCELLFGMVQHALSLNVGGRFGSREGDLFASPEHFSQLIEYEEVILKSGLPMNEIWLRVELLRGAFHYLPFRGGRLASDPQRMVLSDDVVGFVYPLINKSYSFELVLSVLKLMKFPFSRPYDVEEPYETDYPEQLLPVFLDLYRTRAMDGELYGLMKQLSVAPSFIRANIAHESYLELVRQFLALAIDHFEGTQSAILLIFCLRLERMLVCEEKTLSNQRENALPEAQMKSVRARVKNLLKHTHTTNQNSLPVYAEYGLLEYEMSGLGVACRKIFSTSVQVYCSNRRSEESERSERSEESAEDKSDEDDNDLYHLVLTVVDLLLINGHKDEAIRALTNLALKPLELNFETNDGIGLSVSDTTKLSALQKLNDRVNRAVRQATESEPTESSVPTEQHFTQNPMINAIRAYVLYLALIRSNLSEATKQLETFLFLFNELSNPRQRFLREQLYEIYLQLFEIVRLCRDRGPASRSESTRTLLDVIDRTLNEFPSNLYALRLVVFNENLPWLRLRGVLGKHLTPRAVLLLVVAARYRASRNDVNPDGTSSETPYKQRILNLLSSAVKSSEPTDGSVLRQNALLWRLYIRELFDQPNAPLGYSVLEQCRRTLYTALEACPWNKALYLDGASCAPQELSQLLDLMVEKQLRVHAIPEELAILRDE